MGGVIPAIEQGYFQREIARAASDYQSKLDSNTRIMVGVNRFIKDNEEIDIPILEIGGEAGTSQRKKLKDLKESRHETLAKSAIINIQKACKDNTNLVPPIIEAAKAYVTMGEIVVAMKDVFGEWQETPVF